VQVFELSVDALSRRSGVVDSALERHHREDLWLDFVEVGVRRGPDLGPAADVDAHRARSFIRGRLAVAKG
jgi:hypothetical protein